MSESAPATVLVVDDDHDARTLVVIGMTALGFNVLEASSGENAVEVLKSSAPDIAIVDRMMPGMSGGELCRRIKALAEGAYIPVLMLTASDQMDDKIAALEGGVDDYLTKPFHLQELQARVKSLLRVREANLRLRAKNEELLAMQEKLVQKERQLLVVQLAGTAAHQLGQPISAILLNCHLLERLPPGDERFKKARDAIRADAYRLSELLEQLKQADPERKKRYHGQTEILELNDIAAKDSHETAKE